MELPDFYEIPSPDTFDYFKGEYDILKTVNIMNTHAPTAKLRKLYRQILRENFSFIIKLLNLSIMLLYIKKKG